MSEYGRANEKQELRDARVRTGADLKLRHSAQAIASGLVSSGPASPQPSCSLGAA